MSILATVMGGRYRCQMSTDVVRRVGSVVGREIRNDETNERQNVCRQNRPTQLGRFVAVSEVLNMKAELLSVIAPELSEAVTFQW